nr:hypothetical protein [Acetobacter indonesiensis]
MRSKPIKVSSTSTTPPLEPNGVKSPLAWLCGCGGPETILTCRQSQAHDEVDEHDELLAGGQQIDWLKHLVQGNATTLEYDANLHSELTIAVAATIQSKADALRGVRLNFYNPIKAAAMRAYGTVRPDHTFETTESGFLVMKVGSGKIDMITLLK